MRLITKKSLFNCLFFLFISATLLAQTENLPVITLFNKDYYKYEVQKDETIFSICHRFGVTEAAILSMNPSVKTGLKKGQVLLIPVSKASLTLPDTEQETQAVLTGKTPRITLILPFKASESQAVNERYIEFYEGFLLAVDSLKSLGLSFEVQVLDAGKEVNDLKKIIQSGQLDKTVYCVGGKTPEQIKLLAEWAIKKKATLILPFSSNIPEVETNPYIYQLITPQEHIQGRLASYLMLRYAGSAFTFVRKEPRSPLPESSLLGQLNEEFKKNGLSYSVQKPDESLDTLVSNLSDFYENILIPEQMSLNEATHFITLLASASARYPEKKVTLIGYPEWQAMNKRSLQLLYALNTHLFSSFYANFQSQPVRDFQVMFNKTFSQQLLNTYPKYGLMGYDIASTFIPNMLSRLNYTSVKGPAALQNAFQFTRSDQDGGYINQLFYLINYRVDNTIDVKQIR